MTQDEIQLLKQQPKTTMANLVWESKLGNRAFFEARCDLADTRTGIPIPGIFLRLLFRHGPSTQDCNFNFQICHALYGRPERCIALDVYSANRPSHRDDHNGQIFGPHYKIGAATGTSGLPNLGCLDFQQWLEWFCQFSGIVLLHSCQDPSAFELVQS